MHFKIANQRPGTFELSIIDTTIASGAVDEKYFKNALLPTLNLKLGAGLNGIGGNRFIYEEFFLDRKIVSTIPGGYGGAMDELFSGNFHNWGIGFEFIYPHYPANRTMLITCALRKPLCPLWFNFQNH